MALSKSFNDLFITPEKKQNQNHDKFLYFKEILIRKTIHEFTKKTVSLRKKEKLLKKLKKKHIINDYKYDDKSLEIDTNDIVVKIEKLSEVFEKLKKDKYIETEERLGRCHGESLGISSMLKISNDVVTGYIFGTSDENKYLHTWVEYVKDEKEFVADYTKNFIINKDAYYYLYHCKPLNRISKKTLRDELTYINEKVKLSELSIKEYLVFNSEIMRDLSKNKEIIENER